MNAVAPTEKLRIAVTSMANCRKFAMSYITVVVVAGAGASANVLRLFLFMLGRRLDSLEQISFRPASYLVDVIFLLPAALAS